MFVIFNSFFQVAIFYSKLGNRMDDSGAPSAAGMSDFSHFLKTFRLDSAPTNLFSV